MNSTLASFTVLIVCASWVSSAQTQEAKPAQTTNAPVAAPATPPVAAPLTKEVPSVTAAPATPNAAKPATGLTLAPADPATAGAESQTLAELPVIVASSTSPLTTVREDTQRRLEPATPAELIEKYGSVGFLVKQPEPRNFLELINPFAPSDFGGKRREIYNRNPILKPGATLPRNFIHGDVPSEPDLNLFSWPW